MELEKRFKEKLKDNGQTLKWFYFRYIKGNVELTYAGFAGQLNGYSPILSSVKEKLRSYLGE